MSELLIIAIALLAWAVPIAVIVGGVVFMIRLSQRVTALESKLQSLQSPVPGTDRTTAPDPG